MLRTGPLLLAALLALPAAGAVSPTASPTEARVVFSDGRRRVEARPIPGPASRSERRRVRLTYPGLGVETTAEVGREVIVRVAPEAEAGAVLAEVGLVPLRPLLPAAGLWLAEDPREPDALAVAARFADRPPAGVRWVAPDLARRVRPLGARTSPPDDPLYPDQWYLDRIDIGPAWALEEGEPTTSVAVVDTGCDLGHPDLAPKLDEGIDVADGDDDPSYVPGESGAGHGTNVAGLIAAATDNDEGIAGTCPGCRLRCVRFLADRPLPDSVTVAAFRFALDTGAAVVSNSWGYVDPTPVPGAVADAIEAVFDQGRGGLGAVVVFASGNDGREVGPGEILGVRGVLGIGATNRYDEATSFTNSGPDVDLTAPAGTVTTDVRGAEGTSDGDYTDLFGGTSSACPVAAGVAGLVASAAPELTAAEIEAILVETARPAPYAVPDAQGHDLVYGWGIVDPEAALRRALGLEAGPDGGTEDGDGGVSADAGVSGGAGGGGGCACGAGAGSPGAPLLPALLVLSFLLVRKRGEEHEHGRSTRGGGPGRRARGDRGGAGRP